jgi:hypothetical protein
MHRLILPRIETVATKNRTTFSRRAAGNPTGHVGGAARAFYANRLANSK